MKLKYLLVVLTFFVSSCASVLPEPKAWMEKGASLTHYKAFEVLPVQDETGNKARSDFLFKQLVAKLRAKGYSVQSASAQEEETLLLRSVVVAFEVRNLSIGMRQWGHEFSVGAPPPSLGPWVG